VILSMSTVPWLYAVLISDTAPLSMILSAVTSSPMTVWVGQTSSKIVKEKTEAFQEYSLAKHTQL